MHLAKRIAAGAPDRNERRQLFPQRHQCQRARESAVGNGGSGFC
jgi:hypothetical protein